MGLPILRWRDSSPIDVWLIITPRSGLILRGGAGLVQSIRPVELPICILDLVVFVAAIADASCLHDTFVVVLVLLPLGISFDTKGKEVDERLRWKIDSIGSVGQEIGAIFVVTRVQRLD